MNSRFMNFIGKVTITSMLTAIALSNAARAEQSNLNQLNIAYDVSNHIMYASKKFNKPGDVISIIDTESEKEIGTIDIPVQNPEGEFVTVALNQNKDLQIVTESEDAMVEVAKTIHVSQDQKPQTSKYTHGSGLGFSAGFLSGVGFAFRKFYGSGIGFNVAAGAIATQSNTDISTGLEIMKTLDETDSFRFFALTGIGFHHSSNSYTTPERNSDPMDPNPVMVDVNDKTSVINAGIGLGVEYAPAGLKKKGIALSLDCAYAVRFEKSNTYYNGAKPMKYAGLAPLPSFSIIYYFNR